MGSETVSSEEMMVIDENSEYLGVKRIVLMENAGAAVARNVAAFLGDVSGKKIVVLCGPGNNGGDGFAASRHLSCMGAEVKVLLLSDPDKIRTEEAKANYEAVKNMKVSIDLYVVNNEEKLHAVSGLFDEADVIIDAILGTGAKPGLPELFKTAVTLANNSNSFKLAVDVPTGLDSDSGAGETFFQPNLTVALHKPKPVHEKFREGTVVEKIGIPSETEFVAGPGQLKLLVRKMGVAKLFAARLAYIFGESGPDSRTRDLLSSLRGFTAFCDLNMLVENPELRYEVASSRSVLLSNEVNASAIKPFLPRSQPVVMTTPSGYAVNPLYVLWSDKPMLNEFRQKHMSYLRDVEELCKKVAAPVYVVGEVDILSNGVKSWANWLGKPIKQHHFGYAPALTAWFVAAGADSLLAMAATSYLLRNAETLSLEDPSSLATYVHETIEKMA